MSFDKTDPHEWRWVSYNRGVFVSFDLGQTWLEVRRGDEDRPRQWIERFAGRLPAGKESDA